MIRPVRCLCGEIKFALEDEAKKPFYCHCDDCQAVHGAAYIDVALFPHEAVTILKGDPVKWIYKSNSRSHCPACGTLLFAEPAGAPFKGVKVSFLPQNMFNPTFHIQCQYAVLPVVDNLPHYKGFPAMFRGSDETVSW